MTKTNTRSRIVSILLVLAMLLTMVPITALAATYNDVKVNGVSLGDGKYLASNSATDSNYSNTEPSSYVAWYKDGTLTLNGYKGTGIVLQGAPAADLIIKLIGDNTITTTTNEVGIQGNRAAGSITITADSGSNGNLTIDMTHSTRPVFGINGYANSVTITGSADVKITAVATATDQESFGIKSSKAVSILDSASVGITCKTPNSTSRSDTCNGIYSDTGVTINTDGKITIDVSDAGDEAYSYGIRSMSALTLKKVGGMTVKWKKSVAGRGIPLSPSSASFDSDAYVTHVDETNCIATYMPKVAAPAITTGNAKVTAPVAGQTPSFTATSDEPEKYSVELLKWIDVENSQEITPVDLNDPASGYYNYTFKGGKEYTAVVRFTAVGDNTLSLDNSFTINGETTYWTGNGLKRCHTFTATGGVSVATYDLTTSVNGGHGTISAGENGITEGTSKIITFTPDSGYEIDKVMVNGTETTVTGNTLTVTMDGNKNVVVTYKAIEYTITVTGGKATIGAGSEISKAAEGTAVTLTAKAAPSGKVFDKWEVVSGGITLADANSATTTFTMPASAVSVKATYKNAPHTHTYNQETEKPEALKTPAGCTNNAVYFKSCSCGAISTTDTFVAMNTALGHAYGSDWKYDSTNHWHECSRCHDKEDEAAHSASDWIVDTAATETAEGTKHKECTVCNKVLETATIPATHTHSYGTDWKYDDTNHWHECECGDKADVAAHSASDWIVDTAATETAEGAKHKECTVCKKVLETATIPATHTHSYGTDWKYDDTNHWHECECGDKADVAAHSASDWIVDTAATETAEGAKHKECTVCKKVLETATIPATHTHSYGTDWKYDDTNHWHECECGDKADVAAHSASDWIVDTAATETAEGAKHKECTVCNKVLETATIPATHTHSYGTDWKYDDTNHWHECECGDKADVAAHSASDWIVDTAATETAEGAKHKECTVCNKVLETATIPATGSTHTHSYGTDWKSDDTNHWHECECGDKADIAAHSASDWIVDTAATETAEGTEHKECTVCKKVLETATIPATHTHSYGTDWKSDDTNHWHECACGDKADVAAHSASDWIVDTAATETAEGAKHKECTVCKKVLETAAIPATGSSHTHSYGTDWKYDDTYHWHECECRDKAGTAAHSFQWVIDKAATKEATGIKHEECTVCGAKRSENTVIDKLSDSGSTGNTGSGNNNTAKPGKDDSTMSPRTGDSNLIGWLAALFVSGSGLTVLGVRGKKRKESEAE